MRLLLRLDAVRGAMEYRRRVAKRVLALQDAVEALEPRPAPAAVAEEPETGGEGASPGADEEREYRRRVAKRVLALQDAVHALEPRPAPTAVTEEPETGGEGATFSAPSLAWWPFDRWTPTVAEEEKAGEEAEEEYESDLDDAPLPAARRRSAASDDEEEDESGGGGGWRGSSPPSTVSDSDSDGQGAAELYDDVEEEEVYGAEEDEECEVVCEELGTGGGGGGEAEMATCEAAVAQEAEGKCDVEEEAAAAVEGEKEQTVGGEDEDEEAAVVGEAETKKGSEPYAVPTTGAFYMHDNRFQDKENCSRGQFFVWVHDRFHEINFHDSQKDNASNMHRIDHRYLERIKSYSGTKNFDNVLMQSRSYDGNAKGYTNRKDEAVWLHDRYCEINCHDAQHDNVQSRSYDDNSIGYNNASNLNCEKVSRTYQSHWTTFRFSSAANNRPKNTKVSSNAAMGKHFSQTSSPTTFDSSRSSHQGPPFGQRENARVVKFSKLFSSAVHMAHNSLASQSCPVLRKKAFVPSGEHGNTVDPRCMVPIDVMPCSALHSVSTMDNYNEYSESCDQRKYLNIAESAHNTVYLTASPATRPYAQPHNVVYQQKSVQPPILPAQREFAQIFSQKSSGTNRTQWHPQATLASSTKVGDVTTPTEPSNSVVLPEVKGHDDVEEAERTSSHDAGDCVLGVTEASRFTTGDPGSIGIPAKLPVMLFSGQHPTGSGFPSVAMALPGFADQQLGENSEMGLMTWLPMLTDGIVVLEGTHTPPCISSNWPQPSELTSPSASPRDCSTTKDPISLPSQEIPGHELVRHQNRPRSITKYAHYQVKQVTRIVQASAYFWWISSVSVSDDVFRGLLFICSYELLECWGVAHTSSGDEFMRITSFPSSARKKR
ncbi:hypothetical protein EJB05_17178, partial [Eragrostis curvula]